MTYNLKRIQAVKFFNGECMVVIGKNDARASAKDSLQPARHRLVKLQAKYSYPIPKKQNHQQCSRIRMRHEIR